MKKIFAAILVLATVEAVYWKNPHTRQKRQYQEPMVSTRYADGQEVLDALSLDQDDWVCRNSRTGDSMVIVNTDPNKQKLRNNGHELNINWQQQPGRQYIPSNPYYEQYFPQQSGYTYPPVYQPVPSGFTTESPKHPSPGQYNPKETDFGSNLPFQVQPEGGSNKNHIKKPSATEQMLDANDHLITGEGVINPRSG